MRALDCDCGQHLEAPNDEELFERTREHVDRVHPEIQLTDEQVRGIVTEGAPRWHAPPKLVLESEGREAEHVPVEAERDRAPASRCYPPLPSHLAIPGDGPPIP